MQRRGRLKIFPWILFFFTLISVTIVLPVTAQQISRHLSVVGLNVTSEPSNQVQEQTTITEQNLSDTAAHGSTPLEQSRILYEAGRFAEAVDWGKQAVQDYTARGDRLHQALSLNYLSLAYQDLGQWQDAETAIAKSLELLTQTPQPTQPNQRALAQALNTKGMLQLERGETEAALNTWKQAENAYAKAGDEIGVLGSQINQAQALQILGLYRRAKTILEQVQQKLETQAPSPLKAMGLQSLGAALQVVGDLQKAQTILEQSLKMQERLSLSPDMDMSSTLFSLGNTARALQEYERAYELYQQASQKAPTALGKLEAQLNQLSLLIQTEQPAQVQALLPQIKGELGNLPPSRSAVYARVNLADSLMKIRNNEWGSPDVGQLYESGAVISLNGNRGSAARDTPNNPRVSTSAQTPKPVLPAQDIAQILAAAIQQARSLKDTRAESYALGELGRLYENTEQWTDAQNLTQQALSLAQAINASDIAYRWQWQLGRIFKRQGEQQGSLTQVMPQAIAAYSEAVNNLQSLRSDLVAVNPDIQFSFRESVEPVYRQLVDLLLTSPTDKVPSQENLNKARQVIESLQLAELDNYFREACITAKPQQIDRIDPSAAVVYPIILPDRLAVILSLPQQPLFYYQTQIPQSQVEQTLGELLQTLNPAFSNRKRLRLSEQLYDWLIRPAQAQLAASGVKTLVFVPDGVLRSLPMASLYDGQQYLIEQYSIAFSQGLQLLEPRSLVRQQFDALMGGLTEARQGFPSLPAVKSELSQISSEVPAKILLNQEFTIDSLKRLLNTSIPVVHLATHAQFSSKAENTFLLTWEDRINVKDFDELLRTRERQNTNPIELLVLSACQTATGDKRAALGLAGIAVRSGARSTLATLWSVRDKSTAQLMAEFYRALTTAKGTKAEALRQAQIQLLKGADYQHPYYWAPFVLVGNWL
jgi:CHAT domain-containing protein